MRRMLFPVRRKEVRLTRDTVEEVEKVCEVCLGQDFVFLFQLDNLPDADGGSGSYSQCRQCRLVRLDTTLAYDLTQESHVYATVHYSMFAERLYQWIIERIEQYHAPGMMIDVGCSTGTLLAVAKKRGWEVLGFEVSPGLRAIAWHLHRVQVHEKFLDLQQRGIADVVLMSQVIQFVPDPRPYLQRSREVLKPGGLVVLATPNWNFAAPLAWMAAHLGTPMPATDHIHLYHRRLYSPQTMHVLAKQLGWRVVAIYDNPTDYLGFRSGLSLRKVSATIGRLIARATRQRLLLGMNMIVFLEPQPPAG